MAWIPNDETSIGTTGKRWGCGIYAPLGGQGSSCSTRGREMRAQVRSQTTTLEALGGNPELAAGPHRRRDDFQDRARARLDAKAVRMRAHLRGGRQRCRRGAARDQRCGPTHSGSVPRHITPWLAGLSKRAARDDARRPIARAAGRGDARRHRHRQDRSGDRVIRGTAAGGDSRTRAASSTRSTGTG